MKRHSILSASLVFAAIALGLAGPALAANDAPAPGSLAIGGATSGRNARLVALIDNNEPDFVVRSRGVAEVLHPGTGQWCIRPVRAWDVTKIVPAISVDWSLSLGSALLAYYRSSGFSCSAGYINVVTYNFGGGSPVLSDDVAFTIVVP